MVASSVHKTCERKIQEETEATSVCVKETHTQRERVRETKERQKGEKHVRIHAKRGESIGVFGGAYG